MFDSQEYPAHLGPHRYASTPAELIGRIFKQVLSGLSRWIWSSLPPLPEWLYGARCSALHTLQPDDWTCLTFCVVALAHPITASFQQSLLSCDQRVTCSLLVGMATILPRDAGIKQANFSSNHGVFIRVFLIDYRACFLGGFHTSGENEILN